MNTAELAELYGTEASDINLTDELLEFEELSEAEQDEILIAKHDL